MIYPKDPMMKTMPAISSINPMIFFSSCGMISWHIPSRHVPDPQSLSTRHERPESHVLQLPPQSVSVSSPSRILLLQGLVWHVPCWQYPESQSPEDMHCLPSSHEKQDPPQSVSVSSSSLTELAQVSGSSSDEHSTLQSSEQNISLLQPRLEMYSLFRLGLS